MTKAEPTVADLRLLTDGTPFGAGLNYLLAQDHQSRLLAVQEGVDAACNLLEQHKHKKQGSDGTGMGEDEITLEICEMLTMAGFGAAHDDDVGGHCDIVIKGKNDFLWLAEAKKHSSYDWLDKGFKQLTKRYSTGGCVGRDNGDLLIYCFTKDAKAVLDKWREELAKLNIGVTTTNSPCGNQLFFCSKNKHAASGLDFHVRHKAVPLYWKPKET